MGVISADKKNKKYTFIDVNLNLVFHSNLSILKNLNISIEKSQPLFLNLPLYLSQNQYLQL